LIGQSNGAVEFKVDTSGDVTLNGNLNLPYTNYTGTVGVITQDGFPFIHTCCNSTINTFIGQGAGNFYTSGEGSTAFGSSALHSISTGNYNTAIGYSALWSNTTGGNNTAIGQSALSSNTAGGNNTAVGVSALVANCNSVPEPCTALNNTGVGYWALVHNSTGDHNTAIGANADVTSTNMSNATAIGANAVVGASNALVLGSISGVNGATSNVNVGIGTPTPAAALHVASGDVYLSNPGNGVILKSPDGSTCRRLTIDNTGAMVLTALTCP